MIPFSTLAVGEKFSRGGISFAVDLRRMTSTTTPAVMEN